MYTKSRATRPQHDATSTHTNAILHHATTTRLEYAKAVAQEVILTTYHHDEYPIPLTLPLSDTQLTTLANDLTIRACLHCDKCMDAYTPISCGTPFTTQEVQRLMFLRTIRGLSFG